MLELLLLLPWIHLFIVTEVSELTGELRARQQASTLCGAERARACASFSRRGWWHRPSMAVGVLRPVYSIVLIAATVFSIRWAESDLYGGRTAAHVWWYGWITALSTGIGALPFAFVKSTSDWWLGLANAVAGGMMTAASVALVQEGLELGVDERSPFTPLQCVGGGILLGVVFIVISQRVLEGYGDVRVGILEGVDVRRVSLFALPID